MAKELLLQRNYSAVDTAQNVRGTERKATDEITSFRDFVQKRGVSRAWSEATPLGRVTHLFVMQKACRRADYFILYLVKMKSP